MRQRTVYEFDNRDSAVVYQYMEARIEALQRRIRELEAENEALLCTTVIATAERPADDALLGFEKPHRGRPVSRN